MANNFGAKYRLMVAFLPGPFEEGPEGSFETVFKGVPLPGGDGEAVFSSYG
jgi:hypothetical protein